MCNIDIEQGKCQARFRTQHALIQHIVHTNDSYHSMRQYARMITLTNQCIHCRSTFKNRATAQIHAQIAENQGQCPTSRSMYEVLTPITNLECILCAFKAIDHNDMQNHLVSHSLKPPLTYAVPTHRREYSSNVDADPSSQHGEEASGTKPGTIIQTSKESTRHGVNGKSRKRGPHGNERRGSTAGSSWATSQSRISLGAVQTRPGVIPSNVFALARQVHDDRTRRGKPPKSHVDTLATMLNTSERLRSHQLLHARDPSIIHTVQETGRNISRLSLTVSQTKQHGLGPPMIHRGKTLLDQVLLGQEALKEKEGLKPLWPIVLESRNIIIADDMNVDEAANMIGHCKMYAMYDKSFVKLVFDMPYIVTVNGKCTTLGSVVSRLLRSMGFERKTGVAPPGYLERQIKAAIDARKQY